MARSEDQRHSQKFFCTICLELLTDPVTVPCGHSYCSNCIKSHWDGERSKGMYSCPLCRQTFRLRPDLKKNIMLAELLEDLKECRLRAAAVDLCHAGPGDVACDVCTGRKLKAVKSCLVCLVAYCEEHLQAHFQSPAFKNHKLVEPSRRLQEKICSRHDEVMKVFCCTDQQCICYLCTLDQHRGHETVPVATERGRKQKEVEASRIKIQQSVHQREKDVKLLQQQVEVLNVSADEAAEHCEEGFIQMIHLIQRRRLEVKQQVRSQQQSAVRGVRERQNKLEHEIAQLKSMDVQLEQLARVEDHHQFLHSFPSASALGEDTYSPGVHTLSLSFFADVAATVSASRETLEGVLTETGRNASPTASEGEILLPQAQPESREDFLRYSQQITLDPNTANKQLLLSDGNRKVIATWESQPYSYHPDRFTNLCQVMSRESLTGRHYWEVEWTAGFDVGVTYRNITRTGSQNQCDFGFNDRSWALQCHAGGFTFWHNSVETPLSGPPSSRVGMYLDHRAGLLCFYSISDTMTLLHTVQTTFTEPLHAGVNLNYGASAEFIRPQ